MRYLDSEALTAAVFQRKYGLKFGFSDDRFGSLTASKEIVQSPCLSYPALAARDYNYLDFSGTNKSWFWDENLTWMDPKHEKVLLDLNLSIGAKYLLI